MKIALGELRRWIREEVERNMRWSAGIAPGGIAGVGTAFRKGVVMPPPGLGDDEYEDEEGLNDPGYGKAQEKSQFAARVEDREGDTGGSIGTPRGGG